MTAPTKITLTHADYTVACICPMGKELAGVLALLDDEHNGLPTNRDKNAYTLGSIGDHNIVIAVLPATGNNKAAQAATQLMNDFPAVRFGVLVGIGGGIPNAESDIRLGDVVVSKPSGTHGGVVQYDLGKQLVGGKFQVTGHLNKPLDILQGYAETLQAKHLLRGNHISIYLAEMKTRYPGMEPAYFGPTVDATDRLFQSSYEHPPGTTCDTCDEQYLKRRGTRDPLVPRVHYGTIASGDAVIKDAVTRDRLQQDFNATCVEMEAAGIMDDYPCLVIRGISDYADSHKNDGYHHYAAATAAAYMKELLMTIPAHRVVKMNAAKTATPQYQLGVQIGGAPQMDPELFVGRTVELQAMFVKLGPGSPDQFKLPVVLQGIAGIGKTQLALQYVKKYSSSYDSIFWLNADSEARLRESVLKMGRRIVGVVQSESLAHEQIEKRVEEWLSDLGNLRCLLIFDNYDEPDAFSIRSLCPWASHTSVIIITKLHNKILGQCIDVRPLTVVDEGLKILAARSTRMNISNDEYASKLVKRLAGLPLALATAGAYLRMTTFSFKEYIEDYESGNGFGQADSQELEEYQGRTLYKAWNIAYQRLQIENSDAATLLKLFAYFNHEHISYKLFQACEKQNLRWPLKTVVSRSNFESLMKILAEYCFVQVQWKTQSYTIHACVYDWIWRNLNETIDSKGYWFAFNCVSRSVPRNDDGSMRFKQTAWLVPHATRLVHNHFLKACWSDVSVSRCEVAGHVIAGLLRYNGELAAAKSLTMSVLDQFEKSKGTGDVHTLVALTNLAILYDRQGSQDEAERTFQKAWLRAKESLGDENETTLSILSLYSRLLRAQGKFEEAEEMHNQVVQSFSRQYGSNDKRTVSEATNLAYVYMRKGQLAKAEKLFLKALTMHEQEIDADEISTLRAVHDVGCAHLQQKRFTDAEKSLLRAVQGYEALLGPDDINTLRSLRYLGRAYEGQDKRKQAETAMKRASTGYENLYGPDHPSTLKASKVLGFYYADRRMFNETEPMLSRVIRGWSYMTGENYLFVTKSLKKLIWVYEEQNRREDAERLLEDLLAKQMKALGRDDQRTVGTAKVFANLLLQQENSEEYSLLLRRFPQVKLVD